MGEVRIDQSLDGIDWHECKRHLSRDNFDNGRSADALRRAFEQSQHVAVARDGGHVVGMARLLSDGVSNAYLVDVWTRSDHRRAGIGRRMVELLCQAVPGQHVGLQTADRVDFYRSLGFRQQPEFMSKVIGRWLDNDANEAASRGRRDRPGSA